MKSLRLSVQSLAQNHKTQNSEAINPLTEWRLSSGFSMVRYLTGFQPTGPLHIGNYFGALRPAIELQEKGEAFYFIADYHALNTIHEPGVLARIYSRGRDRFAGLRFGSGKGVFLSAIGCSGGHRTNLDPEQRHADGTP